jgi:hypothetical protein
LDGIAFPQRAFVGTAGGAGPGCRPTGAYGPSAGAKPAVR